MSPVDIGIFTIFILLFFLGIGFQIGINFLIAGLVGSTLIIGFHHALILMGESIYYSINVPCFVALPLFILMGSFAARGGFAQKAYDGLNKITAGIPGSLAIATCFSAAAFGAISGSSLATAALFGKLALPEMGRYKYKRSLSLGCIASAGTFACMIPPSNLFIIYAMFTEQSVGRLFAAGMLPGILTAITYSISIAYRVKKNPELAPGIEGEKEITLSQKIIALKQLGPILILALTVLGGIYSGIFTPTEAAAVGALLTLIFGIYLRKLNNLEKVKESLREAAQTTAMIFIIIAGSIYFSRTLALTRLPVALTTLIIEWDVSRAIILAGILFVWFLLGMIMIPTGIFALTLPIIFPVITQLGYNPIWFGVITIKLSEIAAVTPPVGLNVYALKGVAGKEVPIKEIFSGIWPFVLCDIIILILLIIFPQICLFLPNLLFGK